MNSMITVLKFGAWAQACLKVKALKELTELMRLETDGNDDSDSDKGL